MNPAELDRIYTTLSEALGRVGEDGASLFLATLVLDVIATHVQAADALAALARAERLSSV
ncbi:MAG: hypothetical protein ABI277_18995 [Burkholderiaceae bacterium]